MKLKK
jgi:hypothetical protein